MQNDIIAKQTEDDLISDSFNLMTPYALLTSLKMATLKSDEQGENDWFINE